MCADRVTGGNNDDEIYAEEVVEDGGGSELVLVPRREVRVFEIIIGHGGIIIGLCVLVENGGADQTFSQRKEGGACCLMKRTGSKQRK